MVSAYLFNEKDVNQVSTKKLKALTKNQLFGFFDEKCMKLKELTSYVEMFIFNY